MIAIGEMALLFFVTTIVVAGREMALRVWASEEAGPLERAATTAFLALASAVALSWSLALTKMLSREGLVLGAGFVLACALAAGWPRAREELRDLPARLRSVLDGERGGASGLDANALCRFAVVLALVALTFSVAFFLWRGSVVFQPNEDAAAYHLPKAALLARAHGYETFDVPDDQRVTSWPCNYELLLADVLLLDGGAARTSWLSVGIFVFFLLVVGALAERWWGRGRHALVTALLAGAMPVVLLHADAIKNDVLTSALFVLVITYGARWSARGGRASLFLALAGLQVALGTKGTAFFLVAAVVPLAAWGAVRCWRAGDRPTLRGALGWIACAVALFLALGGMVYVQNLLQTGHALGAQAQVQSPYGDWGNVLRFTYLVFARPFSGFRNVWVPWQHAYWHWARYELTFSEWGMPASLLVAVLPLGVARYRRRGAASLPSERALGSFVFVLAFLLILPLRPVPAGFFAAFVRYAIFFPVLVLVWTVAPAVAELDARGGVSRVVAAGCIAASAIVFVGYFVSEVLHDAQEPLDYVLQIFEHPEQRGYRRSLWEDHACVDADRLAGPKDTIAFDGGFGSWSYYCFGAALGRDVIFLHRDAAGEIVVPDAARWVALDRVGSIAFGNPAFEDFSGWDDYLMKGKPTAYDLASFEQMKRDARFRLVRRSEGMNQAVFERVAP